MPSAVRRLTITIAVALCSAVALPAALAAPGDQTTFSAGLPAGTTPYSMAVANDGTIWFDENAGRYIDRITSGGVITRFDNGAATQAGGLTAAPDGSVWFRESTSGRVRRIAADGTITTIATVAGAYALSVGAFDANGDYWTVAFDTHELVRITPLGAITRFARTSTENPIALAIDADGTIWWNEDVAVGLGYRTAAGTMGFVRRPVSVLSQGVWQVKRGPDGHVWAIDQNNQALVRTTGPGTIEDVSLGGSSGTDFSFTFLPDGTAWVPAFEQSVTTRTSGGIVTTHASWTPATTWGAVLGPDGNVWSTSGSITGVTRTLTGIVPENTTAPTLTGTGAVGEVLTAGDGTWNYLPTSTLHSWERCTSPSSGCTTIPGAALPTYTVTADDGGLYLRSVVTATNLNGQATAATATLAIAAPTPTGAGSGSGSGSGSGANAGAGAGASSGSAVASVTTTAAATAAAPTFSAATPRVTARRGRIRISTAVTTTAAGTITQTVLRGTRRLCTRSVSLGSAGTRAIACTARGRGQTTTRGRGVRLVVITTFAPSGGAVQSSTQKISARLRG